MSLADLPELKPNRVSCEELLSSLSNDIVMLSTKNGYRSTNIKKAVESLDIQVSEKTIAAMLKKHSGKNDTQP